jgi:hypothetical protein
MIFDNDSTPTAGGMKKPHRYRPGNLAIAHIIALHHMYFPCC